MIRVVMGIAIDERGHTLMQLRPTGKRRPLMWEWPGGKVDPGELDHVALKREWQEELDVRIHVMERIAFGALWIEEPACFTAYRVNIYDGTPRAAEGQQGLDWFAPAHAVQWMPCTPMTYVFFQEVSNVISNLILQRRRGQPGL